MARIAGIDIPDHKRLEVSLTYVYGIGLSRSRLILSSLEFHKDARMKDLSDQDISRVREFIDENYRVEGDLRSEIQLAIKRLQDIKCYRGLRHRRSLPVRGQRSRTNARTRKGRTKTVAGKKKAPTAR